jgi:hypothetical protein
MLSPEWKHRRNYAYLCSVEYFLILSLLHIVLGNKAKDVWRKPFPLGSNLMVSTSGHEPIDLAFMLLRDKFKVSDSRNSPFGVESRNGEPYTAAN